MDEMKPEGEFSASNAQAVDKKTKTIKVVTVRPIYNRAGQDPIQPGTLLNCCPVTAKFWVRAGIVRWPADQQAQPSFVADTGTTKSAPLPPAPEMVPPPAQPS
ncbi:hypothetical protein [Gluconobacter kondonii]|uniref:hypothetical protein n=1 Tax=Gluconobacter kondonii TaxID=941463 RepID=UPI0019802FEC|nr:hypothetical protein [Gluconobacter kondonii]MBN3866449.1 hypothetical protein [Gluconobacter kondonii]